MAVTVSLYNHTSKLLLNKEVDFTNLKLELLSSSASFTASHTAKNLVDNGSAPATVTMTIASPGVITDTGHGFSAGQPIKLKTTGALPTGLVAGTWYFVVSPTTNTYQLAATAGGSAINTSGSQSGTHTRYASGSYEVYANGWGAGGQALTTVTNATTTTNDALTTADNISVTASGGGIGPASAALLYDQSTEKPLAYIDFGTAKTADVGTAFIVTWSASGIFAITY